VPFREILFTLKVAVTNAPNKRTEKRDMLARDPIKSSPLVASSSCRSSRKCSEALILLKIGFFDHFLHLFFHSSFTFHLDEDWLEDNHFLPQSQSISPQEEEAIILQITPVMRATIGDEAFEASPKNPEVKLQLTNTEAH
jgi:hypothetical protein